VKNIISFDNGSIIKNKQYLGIYMQNGTIFHFSIIKGLVNEGEDFKYI